MSALAADLAAVVRGDRVAARGYTVPRLVGRWLRRHRAAFAAAAVVVAGLALSGAIGVERTLAARDRANAARALAEHERGVAESQGAAADGLVEYIAGDLRRQLADLGRLDLLGRFAASLDA